MAVEESKRAFEKRKFSQDEIRAHLVEGLITLDDLCKTFDDGRHYVVFQMATEIIRLLESNKLAKRICLTKLFPSPRDVSPHNYAEQFPQIRALVSARGTWPHEMVKLEASAEPILHNGGARQRLPFESWWKGKPIYMEGGFLPEGSAPRSRRIVTRRELVKMMRDKIGAHLDEAIPAELDHLQQLGSLGINFCLEFENVDGSVDSVSTQDGSLPTRVSPDAAMMRQIAWEVLDAYADEFAHQSWQRRHSDLTAAGNKRNPFLNARSTLSNAAKKLSEFEMLKIDYLSDCPFKISDHWDPQHSILSIHATLVRRIGHDINVLFFRSLNEIFMALYEASKIFIGLINSEKSDLGLNEIAITDEIRLLIQSCSNDLVRELTETIPLLSTPDFAMDNDDSNVILELEKVALKPRTDQSLKFIPQLFPELFELYFNPGQEVAVEIRIADAASEITPDHYIVAEMNKHHTYGFSMMSLMIIEGSDLIKNRNAMELARYTGNSVHRLISELERWSCRFDR